MTPVALLDRDPAGLDRAAKALGDGAAAAESFTDPEKFALALPELDIDLLDVAVPSPQHAEFVSLLLDICGSSCPPLLVQKPLAQDADTAAALTERAHRLGVRMGVNLNGRYVAPWRTTATLVHDGVVGASPVATLVNRGFNAKDGNEWRARMPRLIGYEMAIHHIDLLRWMFGDVAWVFAAFRTVDGLGVAGDNTATFTLGFRNGALATCVEDWTCRDRAAWQFHPVGEQLVVSGSLATVVADPREARLTDHSGEYRYPNDKPWFPDAFTGPPAEFLDAVRSGRPSELDAADHVQVLRILDAAYASAAAETVVHLPAGGAR